MDNIREKWPRRKSRFSATPRRSLSSIADDIAQLADTAAILDEFSKVCVSAGTRDEDDEEEIHVSYEYFESDSDNEPQPGSQSELQPLPSDALSRPPRWQQHTELVGPKKDQYQKQWAIQSRSVGMWVCQVCGALRRRNLDGRPVNPKRLPLIRRSVTLGALASWRERCDLCYILVEGILAFYKQNKPPEDEPCCLTMDCWPGQHCKVRVEERTGSRKTILSFYTPKGMMSYLTIGRRHARTDLHE
jgi:hypothetical protein